MDLTQNQKDRIAQFIPIFKQYLQTSEYQEDCKNRQQREALFNSILTPSSIDQMTELEFGQVISSLWASQMWGNKSYLVDKMIQENGLPVLIAQMKNLLWGTGDVISRYNEFRKKIRGFGTATLAEILAFVHPDCFGIWNDRARAALKQLGFDVSLSFLNKSQLSGQEYQQFNDLLGLIVYNLNNQGFADIDFLGVNYYFLCWNLSVSDNFVKRI